LPDGHQKKGWDQMIINEVHQVFLGEIGEEDLELHNKLKEVVGNCKVRLWRDEDCNKLVEECGMQGVYNSLTKWINKADMIRMLILYKYGGWYFDIDFELYQNPMKLVTPADELLLCGFTTKVKAPFEISAIYAGIRRHPILWEYLSNIASRNFSGNPMYSTGPLYFSDCVMNVGGNIKILPSGIFFPEEGKTGTYGKHLGHASWVPAVDRS
jgi:mannosyltransferase OCH1-like enzyme